MNIRSSLLVASTVLALGAFLVNCGSDAPSGGSTAGAPAAGGAPAAAAGAGAGGSKAGAPSSAGAPGVAGSPTSAGTSSGGASAGSAGTPGSGGSAGASTGSGGAAAGAGGSAVPATYATVQRIVMMQCYGGSGCHSDPQNPMPLKLDDTLYTTLTTHTTADCGKVIDTANPSNSALVKLLSGPCGTLPDQTPRMPFSTCISDGDPGCVVPEDIAAILAWITKGAPKM